MRVRDEGLSIHLLGVRDGLNIVSVCSLNLVSVSLLYPDFLFPLFLLSGRLKEVVSVQRLLFPFAIGIAPAIMSASL